MKVYELLAKLQKAPAGAEVLVGMHATLNADLLEIDIQPDDDECGQVVLTGGDAQLITDAGDEKGLLSELAAE